MATERVLVVEDFDQLREMLVDGLQHAGFAADGADSVPQALELGPQTYDALVVDLRLGGSSGTDLFRALRDEAVATRFILMTGDERAVDLPEWVPVLLKPFRIGVLVDAVRAVLARSAGLG